MTSKFAKLQKSIFCLLTGILVYLPCFVFTSCSDEKLNKADPSVKKIFSSNAGGLSDEQQSNNIKKQSIEDIKTDGDKFFTIVARHKFESRPNLDKVFIDGVFGGNIYYITNKMELVELDALSLKLKQKTKLSFKPKERHLFLSGFISSSSSKIYVVTNFGKIFAFNKADLSLDFTSNIEDFFTSPLIPDESYLFLKAVQGAIYGLYEMDGKVAWSNKKDGFGTSFLNSSEMQLLGDNLIIAKDISSVSVVAKQSGDVLLNSSRQASEGGEASLAKPAKNFTLSNSSYSIINGKDDLSLFSNDALQVSNTFFIHNLVSFVNGEERVLTFGKSGEIYTISLKTKDKILSANVPIGKKDEVKSVIELSNGGILIFTANGSVVSFNEADLSFKKIQIFNDVKKTKAVKLSNIKGVNLAIGNSLVIQTANEVIIAK